MKWNIIVGFTSLMTVKTYRANNECFYYMRRELLRCYTCDRRVMRVKVFSLIVLSFLLLYLPFAPFNLGVLSASKDRHLLRINVRVVEGVRVYLVSLDPSGYDYVYGNFYVFIEDVHTSKSMAWIFENDWKKFQRLVGNSSRQLSPGIASLLDNYGIKAKYALPVNSTTLLAYVYRNSEGLLNDTSIISALREGLKRSLGMELKNLVVFVYPLSKAQESLYDLFIQRMNESKEELLKKYGVVGFGIDFRSTLPVIRVDSNKMAVKGVSQEEVLEGISAVLGNLSMPIEVIFSNAVILPAINTYNISEIVQQNHPQVNLSSIFALITVIATALILFTWSSKHPLQN